MAAPGALDVEQRAALGGTGDLASWEPPLTAG